MESNLENVVDASSDTSLVDLRTVWKAIDSQIYRVVTETGEHAENAHARRLTATLWIYVDDLNGFSVMPESEVAYLLLVPVAL